MRIRPDRPGYSGYSCESITVAPVTEIDCHGNEYTKLPPAISGRVTDTSFENLSAIDSDSTLQTIVDSCDQDYNPFTGTLVDLYQSFVDNSYEDVLEADCYDDVDDSYGQGYMHPAVKFFIESVIPGAATGQTGRDGGEGEIGESSSSSSMDDCEVCAWPCKVKSGSGSNYVVDVYDEKDGTVLQSDEVLRVLNIHTGEDLAADTWILGHQGEITLVNTGDL